MDILSVLIVLGLLLGVPLIIVCVDVFRSVFQSTEKSDSATTKSFPQEFTEPTTGKIQFGIMQMLISTTVVGFVLGIFKMTLGFKEPFFIIIALWVALAIGGVTLIAKKGDYTVRTLIVPFLLFCMILVIGAVKYLSELLKN
jgi:F0F1-type ATP synthase assembly protein I